MKFRSVKLVANETASQINLLSFFQLLLVVKSAISIIYVQDYLRQ